MKAVTLLLAAALPLAAQWDVRLEIPRPQGQSLPQTFITGTGELVSGGFDTGKGYIATVSRRFFTFGPIARLEWGVEYGHWTADGTLNSSTPGAARPTTLSQQGIGAGINLQLWVPFVGLGGEIGVIERLQRYKATTSGAEQSKDLARPWLRVGARWRLPFPVIHPYLAAAYQQPITKDKPVKLSSTSDLQSYLNAQGNGQEFERMWTFGVGLSF
jgi:hypothetical protein